MNTLQGLIERFDDHGSRTALVYRGSFRRTTLTYDELRTKVLKTCSYLDSQGVHEGDKALIWCYNRPEWGVVFLACAVKGVTAVPVDILADQGFVERVNDQVDATHLFKTRYKPRPDVDAPITHLEDLFDAINDYEATSSLPGLSPDDAVEIAYTSGTTGTPKGVVLTHENIASNLESTASFMPDDGDKRFLSVLPLSHLFEQNPGFLFPLFHGASIVHMRAMKPSSIRAALREEPVTNAMVVPRLLASLRDAVTKRLRDNGLLGVFRYAQRLAEGLPLWARRFLFAPVRSKLGRSIEHFTSGGAPLDEDLEAFWESIGIPIQQGYGLTECSPVVAANPLDSRVAGSVGKPIHGVDVRVDDEEILVRGDNVFKSYYDDEDATEEAFDGDWFKTGDVGEIREEYLFLNGRKKDVIVTSAGMNVYPEDVEAVLDDQPGVKHACVFGRGNGDETVFAAIIPENRGDFDARTAVREANKELNSAQQIRDHAVWPHEDFPRTTTKKVKKGEVARLIETQNADDKAVSSDESKLHRLIADVCDVSEDVITDEATLTTDLGLDSVARIELVSYIEQEYNVDFDESRVDQDTTVEELEEHIEDEERRGSRDIDAFRDWTINPVVERLRSWGSAAVLFLMNWFFTLHVHDEDRVTGLDEPVVFVANHTGYADTPAVMKSLSRSVRDKTLTAMHTEYFEDDNGSFASWRARLLYYAALFFGAVPFPRTRRFTRNMEVLGGLLDKDYNVLFFPEGEHVEDRIGTFHDGIGFIALYLDVTIIPVKIRGTKRILRERDPSRDVHVRFGEPRRFKDGSVEDVAEDIRRHVQDL